MSNNFKPIALFPENCGSTTGLEEILITRIKIIMGIYSNSYFTLKVDINLYYRILKVLYKLYNMPNRLKMIFSGNAKWDFIQNSNFCMLFGTWHPFKVACEQIQKHFLFTFIGPGKIQILLLFQTRTNYIICLIIF